MLFVQRANRTDFLAADGAMYSIAGWRRMFPYVKSDSGPAATLWLLGPMWLLPVGFPFPGVPLGLGLAIISYYLARRKHPHPVQANAM